MTKVQDAAKPAYEVSIVNTDTMVTVREADLLDWKFYDDSVYESSIAAQRKTVRVPGKKKITNNNF